MKKHIIIENSKDCCGCGACVNCCPCNAISMKEDEAGFIFPAVDETLCVLCGKCVDVCVFNEKGRGAGGNPEVYAAVTKNREILEESSSGGVFTALANAVLDKGGAVFGAAWNDKLSLEHICVENKNDLEKLRGSKYVQSCTKNSFKQAKSILQEGRAVCYCATPCQIAGLKAFLGKDYDMLLTVDLVCHGVPSIKMLHDDLKDVAGEEYAKITDIRFRDKRYGWAVKGSLCTSDAKEIKYNASSSPYYYYFLKGEIYRESCYNCRFPSEGRQGDITLGDYWGIRAELINKLGDINPDKGISCVLVNTPKGKEWFDSIENSLNSAPSNRESAEKRNKQLTTCSKPLPEHQALLDGYIKKGHAAFNEGYKKHKKDHIIRAIKNIIPAKIKRKINDILSK